jgi:DNA-binding winged helix-turn-helix (wHTH) protein
VIFAFGDYELDEERFELRRGGSAVELQPKALELLLHLVRKRDQVVSKRELLETVWADSVVTDGSLARAVSLARRAIGDRGTEPASIATVARRGYRFQAAVRESARRSPAVPPIEASHDDPASRYIGRAELLARLEVLLDAALRGRGRILFLAGEAGIGKTRTAELLAERARHAGAEVATSWGLDRDDPTYLTWTRVLRALANAAPEALAALPPAQRSDLGRLMSELGGAGEPGPVAAVRDGQSIRFQLFEAVQTFLARSASRRPVALFLDDLHAADAESLWLLEHIGHALGAMPIAIVVTCREDDAARAPQRARALERLLRSTSLERWPLAGLSVEEVREFVRTRLGRDPDPALVGALERKTAGNPLLLGESLRSLEARGLLRGSREASAWDALLPRGIEHLLHPKLKHLSPGALEVLACASAIGVEVDQSLLARCLGGESDLEARLREAEDAALLFASAASTGRLRFAHALARDALYAELVPAGDRRRALHARIAAALDETETASEASGDSLAERAHHACEAAPLVDPGRAIGLARAAGEQAARLHDSERAAAWYQRALAMLELGSKADAATRVALYLGLGAAQVRTVGLERARATCRAAVDHARSSGRSDLFALAVLGFAHRPTASGHGDREVIDLLEEAARTAPADEALRIRVLSRLAGELRYAEPARAEALVDGAVASARALGDTEVLAHALDDATYVRWSPGDPESWIALNGEVARVAHAANDLELVLDGQKGRVTGFLELGDVAAVDREIRACERTADALRTPYARWLCAAMRAMRVLLDGDLELAERCIGESIRLGERVDAPEVNLELQVQFLYLRAEQRRGAEIESAMRSQGEHFPDAPAWRAGLARVLIGMGRSSEARSELQRLARRHFTDVPRDRGWLPTLAFAAEVACATGDAHSAEILERLLAPYARLSVVAGSGLVYYGSVSHHLGLVAAAQSRWDPAVAWFESALAAEVRAGAHIWEARTRVAFARALLSRGEPADRARAASLLADAVAAARARDLGEVSAEARALEPARWTRRVPARAKRTITDR